MNLRLSGPIPLLKVLIISAILLAESPVRAQWSVKESDSRMRNPARLFQVFTEKEWNQSNFAKGEDLQWFRDAKYGMFIHFGLSRGQNISWGVCRTRKWPDVGEGKIEDEVWQNWPKEMKLENFDAIEWVKFAKDCGFKYIVVIAKHHDGFHMWDTALSDFKVTNTPFGRDYLKEIADECHRQNMRLGIYYSQRDWHHPDYAPLVPGLPRGPEYRPGPTHERYIRYQFDAVRELCTKYGKVDVFWFDAVWWDSMFIAQMWDSEKLTRMIRELQPGILINNRASLPGDFDTPEQRPGMFQTQRPWESCISLTNSWSWTDTSPKPCKDLVLLLSRTVCGDGNLLVSWGAKWDGAYDEDEKVRLREVGNWLDRYGAAIYGTRGGPWRLEDGWGSTYCDKIVYVHVYKWSGDELKLTPLKGKILKAELLTGGAVDWRQDAKGVVLKVPCEYQQPVVTLIRLTLDRPVGEVQKAAAPRSLFDDPAYGRVISEKATFSISSTGNGKEAGAGRHNTLVGGKQPYTIQTLPESNPWAVVDLGKVSSIKGVRISNALQAGPSTPEGLQLSLSIDGKTWTPEWKAERPAPFWEVAVLENRAGADLPGKSARYLKLEIKSETPRPLLLQRVEVYGD